MHREAYAALALLFILAVLAIAVFAPVIDGTARDLAQAAHIILTALHT